MDRDMGGQTFGQTFRPINSVISAGKNINVYSKVTVNNSESSILSRLKSALNPVTSATYDSYEAKQRSECFPNTRIQVLHDIEGWLKAEYQQAPIYVLDGVAGIGKSTVAQTIATRAAALGLLGASFFFTRDEDQRSVARHFFPTVAYQLGCYDGQFATHISQSLYQTPDASTKRLCQQLFLLLIEPLQHLFSQRSKPTLIVIDALDECEEENAEELLLLLGQHVHRMKGLKFLITMRPEAHLREILDQDKNHESFRLHEIEDSIIQADIQLYLQSRLSVEEIRKASRNRQNPWQPTGKDMEMLCGICGTLFIIAATATKFILDRKRLNPEKQLARLLDGVSSSGFTGSKYTDVLDETYLRIIFAAHPDLNYSDDDWFRDLNRVLGALIALSNPLPCKALASLLNMAPEDVEGTLSQLHSLVAPMGRGGNMTFRIHHKSFPDFITNKERIRHVLGNWQLKTRPELDSLLWIDVLDQNSQLAKACFRIMNHNLKWNMANIKKEDWYKDKRDILHFSSRLIPRDLAYAALQWASHLRSAYGVHKNLELQDDVTKWTSRNILAWMEVMVILDQVDRINEILQDAIEGLKYITQTEWRSVQELLYDAYRFASQGSEVMKISPLHIYWSCLPLVPVKTTLFEAYNTIIVPKIGVGRAYQWNPLVASLIGHTAPLTSIAFSSDASRLASASNDRTIRIWDAKTGSHIVTLAGRELPILSVAFSSDGYQLASGSSNVIQLWDTKTWSHIATLVDHTAIVNSVAFSSDGRLASGSDDKTIRLWHVGIGVYSSISTLTGHLDSVTSIAFSGDGSRLASGSKDNTIRLWDARMGSHIATLTGHSGSVHSVAIQSDGCRLASGSEDNTIRLWNASTGAHITTITGHSGAVNSVAFSRDGSQLASGSRDTTTQLWDAKTGDHISTFDDSYAVTSVAFSPDGSQLASGPKYTSVRVWDAAKRGAYTSNPAARVTRYFSHINTVSYSCEGSRLASASSDRTVGLWDATTGTHIATLTGHSNVVWSVAFSSDSCQLASGSGDTTIRLWNAKTGTYIATLTGHSDSVYSVAYSSDGRHLASGSSDLTLRLWDAEKGTRIAMFTDYSKPVYSVTFSRDGSRLLSESEGNKIRVWNTRTCVNISTFADDSDFLDLVTQLASEPWDGQIQTWYAKTGTQVSTLMPSSDLTIISFIFLGYDSQLVNRVVAPQSRLLQSGDSRPVHLVLAVKREFPSTTGLMLANLLCREAGNFNWEVVSVYWFHPDVEARCLAVNHLDCRVAVGCSNGQLLSVDFSSISHPI